MRTVKEATILVGRSSHIKMRILEEKNMDKNRVAMPMVVLFGVGVTEAAILAVQDQIRAVLEKLLP